MQQRSQHTLPHSPSLSYPSTRTAAKTRSHPRPNALRPRPQVRARLLHVDTASKAVRLSLLPHLVNRAMPAPLPSLGQLLEVAQVKR